MPCLVSTACINVEPPPSLKSPAVFVAVGVQSNKDSWLEKRISNGSWIVVPKVLAPKAITCLSWSDTNICLATVGVLLAPDSVDISTALVVKPSDLSQ